MDVLLKTEQFHGNMDVSIKKRIGQLKIDKEASLDMSGTARASDLFYLRKKALEAKNKEEAEI